MTDIEIKERLKNLIILYDSREKKIEHIVQPMLENSVVMKKVTLDVGDYSCMIPKTNNITLLGESFDLDFRSRIVIERKNSIEELSNCLSNDRSRFTRELERSKAKGTKFILLVENGSYERIIQQRYNTELNCRSFMASLHTFQARYSIDIEFISSWLAWNYIYKVLYYFVREELKAYGNGETVRNKAANVG